jgi:hypothetical protein
MTDPTDDLEHELHEADHEPQPVDDPAFPDRPGRG